MTTPLFPAPLPAWARAALGLAPLAWTVGAGLYDYLSTEETAEELTWCHIVASAQRTGPTVSEDHAQVSFDFLNVTDGAIDNTWTEGDLDDVYSILHSLLMAWIGHQEQTVIWDELRFYLRRFNAVGPGFADMGDPVRITTQNLRGSATNTHVLPYQCALTVTEKTTQRAHWGRMYIPNPSSAIVDDNGRFTQAAIAAIATEVEDSYADAAALDLYAVVPSAALRTLFFVTQVQVDDIPDVQRRRRSKTTILREVRPV